ncbi:Dot/Icm T4SS effector VpdC [Legionella brunensis]|uniref:Esterase of the alpha-beta hydrolase superfamily protein n=1 Tax=Legionella brunensis TaxID=29422 RepID=A0A0W0S519_9GAMM|nr:Dot/Icm T4SS effector VpdC [Legionella brunensis]KTC78320.1 esterase of the alpha-beta hydrolase superfamily protein [Legionella brunensis]
MPRENVLSALLRKDTVIYPNILLLKKFLLCVHQGWFRINGASPDEKYTLGDYLLDDERVIIDFTRMSEQYQKKFLNWFLVPHSEDAHQALLTGAATSNYRGYTAEVGLSWWGRVVNLLFSRKKSYHWHLTPFEISLNYQLTGLEICQDVHGLLIGLNQFAIENNDEKYHAAHDNQPEPLRNTKRVLLTDDMVEKLISTDIQSHDFDSTIYNPHPFSIKVVSSSQRMQAMREYRQTQRFFIEKPWYSRIWEWVKTWFETVPQEVEMEEILHGSKKYRLFFETGDVRVFKRESNGQILVVEKRPDLDSMVFCGGGAKIFAHVGALKAFDEAGIKPTKYAGSSAGAIMAILGYLGYNWKDILVFFQWFKQENIIHYDIDSSGLSDARAMKAALDYMITKKVNEIIQKYEVDKTAEGRRFLAEGVFKHGKITFESLHLLKKRYPDCGLGEKLTVTATNVESRKTRYFSYATTPWMEVSEAGKTSASFPVVFKPTVVEGATHKDGGILNNFPTEVFKDDLSTLLESEHGNCLSMVAFQFDNGYERNLLDKFVDRVYRENFVWNWIYGLLTGVTDPVSGWEKDRLKLLQHSNQVVLIPTGNVSSTQFDLDLEAQNTLVRNGYEAAKNYINARYGVKNDTAKNKELMYSSFASMEELLYFSCYRGHEDWFEKIASEAKKEGISEQKIHELREHYFTDKKREVKGRHESPTHSDNFPLKLSGSISEKQWLVKNMQLFEAIYPVFHKIPYSFLTTPHDLKLFKLARHSLSLNRPLTGLRYLRDIKGDVHILLSIFIQILNNSHLEKVEEVASKLQLFSTIMQSADKLKNATFYGKWDLLVRQSNRVLKVLSKEFWNDAFELCSSLKQGEEPLETIIVKDAPIEEGMDHVHTDNWFIERNRTCFSM